MELSSIQEVIASSAEQNRQLKSDFRFQEISKPNQTEIVNLYRMLQMPGRFGSLTEKSEKCTYEIQ